MKLRSPLLVSLLLASVAACSSPSTERHSSAVSQRAATNAGSSAGVALLVTVDWEGMDLQEANLAAMEDLRARYPQARITHFLNAAYYTKPDADASQVTAAIQRVIRPGDELGLHIHGWKRLFEAAGVTFRSDATFWGGPLDTSTCDYDCGHEVPISEYTETELTQVVSFSVDTLSSNGFGRATAFRAGGWLGGDTVRAALYDDGFVSDHSAVPSTLLAGEIGGTPLLTWVSQLWPGTTTSAQPYAIAAGQGQITEVPDNGALADYATTSDMVSVFDGAVANAQQSGAEQVVSIGFHQETAQTYLSRVESALDQIAQRAANGVAVRYAVSREVTR